MKTNIFIYCTFTEMWLFQQLMSSVEKIGRNSAGCPIELQLSIFAVTKG